MLNVLVTGGAGFIGSNLCKILVENNYKVTSLDNYSTGLVANHIDGVEYINYDCCDIGLLSPKFDTIFHLGEYARVESSFTDIDLVFEKNLSNLYQVLKFTKNCSAKLIYAGSSTKFAKYCNCDIESPYAFIKTKCTEIVGQYSKWAGINYAITYFYNVYGPNEIGRGKYATVVEKFLTLFDDGATSVPVTLPGLQERNFTHVLDIVEGLILVAEKGQGDNFCIGSDERLSIIKLANLIGLSPDLMPEKIGNRVSARLDTYNLSRLGWVCKLSIRDYINKRITIKKG